MICNDWENIHLIKMEKEKSFDNIYERNYVAVVFGCYKREAKIRKLSMHMSESRWFNGLMRFLYY